MATGAEDVALERMLPRTIAGATVLQIVPALHDNLAARETIAIAHTLVNAGARAIVAGEYGGLVDQLNSFGGEWLSFPNASFNPAKLRRNAEILDRWVADERIDIIHAKNGGAAWSALIAVERHSIFLVTDLPDVPRARMRLASFYLGALSRGDRVITRSLFHARPMMQRHRVALERVSFIPHSIDAALFDPAKVRPEQIAAMRHAWGIPSGVRVILVPGQVAPRCGQITLVETARMLVEQGLQGVTFVLAGDDRQHRRYVRSIRKRARAAGVEALFRIVGHCADMPGAYATAEIVVAPYITPPTYGRAIAEAQAMSRPVIASAAGALPENLLAPPHVADHLRTGWLVRPGDPVDLAEALRHALALDAAAYRAMAVRAGQFGRLMFAPQRVAAAALEVYSSLLAVDD